MLNDNPTPREMGGPGIEPQKPMPCDHFPPMVRDALVAASQTPITKRDPMARIKAIDRAIEKSRATHPELFKRSL